MAELTVQDIARTGLNVSMSNADAAGDTFHQTPDGNVFIQVENGAAASRTVTVTAENTSKSVPGWGDLTASDVSVAIPAGESRLIGPFPQGPYTADPTITYDDETSVTVAAIRLPKE